MVKIFFFKGNLDCQWPNISIKYVIFDKYYSELSYKSCLIWGIFSSFLGRMKMKKKSIKHGPLILY